MSKKPRDGRPYIPPVTRIELSEKNIRQRWILIIVLVLIAVVSIGMGIRYALDVQPGWNEIAVNSSVPNYSTEVKLMYDFSETGGDAAAVNKQLTTLYSQAAEDAYRFFSKDAQEDGCRNLYYLNSHINEEVFLERPVYEALELLNAYNNRCIFLAPVYVEYQRVFRCTADGEAAIYDPGKDPQVRAYLDELMTYVSDENHICIELSDGNAQLIVSQEYQNFALEYGIEEYLDLAWMRNAFVTDYIAGVLLDNGYTHGYLVSYDGYTRNLDLRNNEYHLDLFDKQDADVYGPAKLSYTGSISMVFLRNYPLSQQDSNNFYVYSDGSVTSLFVDPQTGVSETQVSGMVSYSREKTCSQVLMDMIPVLFGQTLSLESISGMAADGVYSVWFQDGTLCYNDQTLKLEMQPDVQGNYYEKTFIQ